MSYLLLFLSAFGAATLLPLSSEIAVIAMLTKGYSPVSIWLVASIGNTLGSVVNYVLGRYFLHFQHKRWFPFTPVSILRAQQWFNKYGQWSLLFAWAPIVGDALTFIAGMMRTKFLYFVVLVFIGKGVRYFIIIGAYQQFW